MKALSSHLTLSILGGLEIGGLSSQKFSYAPQTHSIPVLFCGVLELRLVTHLCVVASIFNVWLLWFWYWSSCSDIHVRVSTKRNFFPLDHLTSQNLIWILPKNTKYPSFWKQISIMSVHVSSRLIILLSYSWFLVSLEKKDAWFNCEQLLVSCFNWSFVVVYFLCFKTVKAVHGVLR